MGYLSVNSNADRNNEAPMVTSVTNSLALGGSVHICVSIHIADWIAVNRLWKCT